MTEREDSYIAGTKSGSIKAQKTMLEKYGSKEAYREHMRKIGSKGGNLSRDGGFASELMDENGLTGKMRASIAGRKGGLKSKRTKKVQ